MADDYSYSSSVSDDPNAIHPELLPMELSPEEIFDNIDLNGDGIVTKREYKQVFPELDVDMVFLAHDHNRDGVVSRQEFLGGREYGNPLSVGGKYPI